ncbi:MAG: hotdog domain-containing protein [Ilumatobacteraceae bacterium]
MTLVRLTNERWGFRSNCFVCEPTNGVGLRQPFFHDVDAGLVVADIELGDAHSGAPSYVHGGVQLALLDEAMAWAAIAIAGRFAATASFSSEFHHPLKIDRTYRLEASIDGRTAATLSSAARIVDDQGRVRTSAAATLVVLSAAQAIDAGAALGASTEGFTRT